MFYSLYGVVEVAPTILGNFVAALWIDKASLLPAKGTYYNYRSQSLTPPPLPQKMTPINLYRQFESCLLERRRGGEPLTTIRTEGKGNGGKRLSPLSSWQFAPEGERRRQKSENIQTLSRSRPFFLPFRRRGIVSFFSTFSLSCYSQHFPSSSLESCDYGREKKVESQDYTLIRKWTFNASRQR